MIIFINKNQMNSDFSLYTELYIVIKLYNYYIK